MYVRKTDLDISWKTTTTPIHLSQTSQTQGSMDIRFAHDHDFEHGKYQLIKSHSNRKCYQDETKAGIIDYSENQTDRL